MKVEKLTIAHISDLHRSEENPISNVSLLNSLLEDHEKYLIEGISKPDILIVSGDIVQGDDDSAKLVKQYDEALEFLINITNQLFEGDRSKIVLIPGNHDVSWGESKKSMVKIEEKEVAENGKLKSDILREVIKTESDIKWSWSDRSFYQVKDKTTYNNRFSFFCDMYHKFYEGDKTYSLDPLEQFEIFDYSEYGIAIVGFNSCFHNDHLNKAGAISPACIAKAGYEIRELKKQGRLILATWHHNTKGGPYDQDYMDGTFIKNLISSGVKIGFHGHQHKNEIVREENDIIDRKMMLIISSGSLCAGYRELPPGYAQQYSLLELLRVDTEAVKINLHSRVKTPDSSFDNPIWGIGSITSTSTEFSTNISHSTPEIIGLEIVEKLLGEKQYTEAKEILEDHDMIDPLVRVLLLECYNQLDEYSSIIERFSSPKNNTECISLMNASIEVGRIEHIKQILNIDMIKESTDTSLVHLRDQLRGRIV